MDRGSVAIHRLRVDQPVSVKFSSQVRLANAITRLCARVAGHSHLAGTAQAVGTSISVGIKIFSIAGGSGFVVGLFRGYGQ